MARTYRQLITSTRELFSSVMDNGLNTTMKLLAATEIREGKKPEQALMSRFAVTSTLCYCAEQRGDLDAAKKYLDELRGEIDEAKAKIASGEQPVFDSVDALFAKLEADRWPTSLHLPNGSRNTLRI